MCELLGICLGAPATMAVYFKAFRPRAASNREGWGIGWYADGRACVVKEARRADESEQAAAMAEDPPSSSMFLIHVRHATVGRVSEQNTHPFLAHLNGRDWLFGHNGTLLGLERLEVGAFAPAGDTDSEVALYHLLTRLARLGDRPSEEEIGAEVLTGARELSEEGKANFLLTDGRTMYAYFDGHKTLHYLERRGDAHGSVRVADDADYVVDLRIPEHAPGVDDPAERAVVFASVPLTDEPWLALRPGELLVCREGRIVHRVGPGEALP